MRHFMIAFFTLFIAIQGGLMAIDAIVKGKKTVVIYLAGKIPKGDQSPDNPSHWTQAHMDHLRAKLDGFEVVLLNPVFNDSNLKDQDAVFGRDMHYVASSDIIFVDARGARGVGVGVEMMWAKVNQIPVVSWAPKNTHYNRSSTVVAGTVASDFIHPFVNALSDQIVENIAEGAEWIKNYIKNTGTVKIKDLANIRSTIEYYKANQMQPNELVDIPKRTQNLGFWL